MKMKLSICIGSLLLIFGITLVGCQNPDSVGTIQINNETNGGCVIWVTLDGNNAVTISGGGSYNYSSVSPGSHTVAYHTTGTNGPSCGFNTNGNTTASCGVSVNGGDLYAATLTNGANGAIITYTCP